MWQVTVVINRRDGSNPIPIVRSDAHFGVVTDWVKGMFWGLTYTNFEVIDIHYRFIVALKEVKSEETQVPF